MRDYINNDASVQAGCHTINTFHVNVVERLKQPAEQGCETRCGA